MKRINRWRKLKSLGCIKYKNGRAYIDDNKLDNALGNIDHFWKYYEEKRQTKSEY